MRYNGIKRLLFANHPDDISFLKTSLRIDGRQVLLSFLQSYNHATVDAAYATLFQRLAYEGTIVANDDLL